MSVLGLYSTLFRLVAKVVLFGYTHLRGNALASINAFAVRRIRLALEWVIPRGISLGR